MPLSYYIYYRVARADEARLRVDRLQRGLSERLSIRGRVLKKRDEPSLWMEVYEGVVDAQAFESLLATLVNQVEFEGVLAADSQRKSECFEEGPCA